MKILFLVKYFEPFDRGGSEWSTHDLAEILQSKGHEVTILTPNYGAKSIEVIDRITIIRFPFPIKLKNQKAPIAPYWTNNIFWFLYTGLIVALLSINGYQIIHVQNNEFLPAATIANLLFGKKTVATFRDYQALCNLGFCLWDSDKACNLKRLVSYDFKFFWDNYVQNKTTIKYYLLLTACLRAYFMQKIIYYCAKNIDHKVAVSKKVASIFEKNGIYDIKNINNVVLMNKPLKKKKHNTIVYVGKLSLGKGVDMLVDILPDLTRKLKSARLEIIGGGQLKNKLTKKKFDNLEIFGHLDHETVLGKIAQAKVVVVPSRWQEPLPRSVIESLLVGTPVVATNTGGIEEIMAGQRYGALVLKGDEKIFLNQIVKTFKKSEVISKKLDEDYQKLRTKFSEIPALEYEKLYKKDK